METVTVEIINAKAYHLLEDLAAMDLIRLRESAPPRPDTPRFGFAKDMIKRVDDDFNEPLSNLSDYMP